MGGHSAIIVEASCRRNRKSAPNDAPRIQISDALIVIFQDYDGSANIEIQQ